MKDKPLIKKIELRYGGYFFWSKDVKEAVERADKKIHAIKEKYGSAAINYMDLYDEINRIWNEEFGSFK